MSETKNLECPEHGPYMTTVIVLAGREHPGRCPQCVADDRALEHAREEARNREVVVGRLYSRADIPLRYVSRTFDNFNVGEHPNAGGVLDICRQYAERFEERLRTGCGLILCGKPGTGKTHLACAIARTVIDQGRSARYFTVASAVRMVKQTFAPGSHVSEGEALERFYRPELLILDEVGMQRGTEYELSLLAEVMNERYARVLPTVIATNLTHMELARYIGERALDRMREGGGVVLALPWESYRGRVELDSALTWPKVDPVDFAELASK